MSDAAGSEASGVGLLTAREPGWSLPGPAYTDPALFELEMRAMFGRSWLFLGPTAALPLGSARAWTVGGESVIVSRTAAGLHAHANVCAHRGSRLVDADGPLGTGRIVCPYHCWAYDLDGSLAGAPLMGAGFNRGRHGLLALPVRDLAGLLFVRLDPGPDERADFAAMERDIAPHLAPYDLGAARLAATESYRVGANWKTITENNRECYHCKPNHPEFCLTNFEFGVAGDPRFRPPTSGPWRSRPRRGSTRGWRRTRSASPMVGRTASRDCPCARGSSPRA